jgi:DNA recombination protein RmuC
MDILTLILSGLSLLTAIAVLALVLRQAARPDAAASAWQETRRELTGELRASRQETAQAVAQSVGALSATLSDSLKSTQGAQDQRLTELRETLAHGQETLQKNLNAGITGLDQRTQAALAQQEQKLEAMRQTMESRLRSIQADNNQKLDEMRATVNEKLQKTLEERIGHSFQLVSARLEEVYKGLGEMQTLAAGVGDLKRVLSNVKTRGMLGELQLGAILAEILAPEQYETNVATRPGSREVVEYAVKLPGDGDTPVYLPIDAKYPGDTYEKLLLAYETGRADEVEAAAKTLEQVVRQMARDIRDKYVDPPHTTDFGILFLPVEGLYAEVVRRGMVETLQRDFRVNLAGPTTMAALLNALQMGFKTLAVQKRSSQVWEVLGAVKTEFARFSDVLQHAQKGLDQIRGDLDNLVGVRTRQIERRLKSVSTLEEPQARSLLDGE